MGPIARRRLPNRCPVIFRDHVPLFFLLGAGWAHLVGWTQFALRLFSVLAGVLMIAWLYRLGSDVFNRRTGLAAALLIGTSAYMILYVHNFRMYPLPAAVCRYAHLVLLAAGTLGIGQRA